MPETKTFLFTDIVASVILKSELPGHSVTERDEAFIELVLAPHRERIERNLLALGGRVVSTAGDGHFLVFSNAVSAARWAIDLQRSHRDAPILTPRNSSVAVRISMHLGSPQIDPNNPDNFVGKAVDYAARLCDYATSGQILASRSIVALLHDEGMDDVLFHSHGRHELKGIGPVEVCELMYDGSRPHVARVAPRESSEEEWTVLPVSMSLRDLRPPGRSPKPQSAISGMFKSFTATATDLPQRLGNYELEARLGSGGMGDVYRARHVQNGLVRAVKVIKRNYLNSEHSEVIGRFYQEIRAVCKLEHPNIVTAIDSSVATDDVHYLVMEYIAGTGVDKLVAKYGALEVADACEIARQAAHGLMYIHEHDMVHRDIKPSNLMVTAGHPHRFADAAEISTPLSNGQGQPVVKILDLGLALLVGDDQQRLTLSVQRPMGTAMYMSPEQWKTTSVDIRADIYSLGCTLYHLLAGNPPFWESDLKPEKAHEREILPPFQRELAVPREVWDILQRMMAKHPNDRFASPAAVADSLAPFAKGNQLPQLLEKVAQGTAGGRISDTVVGRGKSDTRVHTPQVASKSRARDWGRHARPVMIVAAVLAIGWFAIVRPKSLELQHMRQEALERAARTAAGKIVSEINNRFKLLSENSRDSVLREGLLNIEQTTDTKEKDRLRLELASWLNDKKANSSITANSMTILDRIGTGVATSGGPGKKVAGKNVAYRDYFHGKGTNLPEDTNTKDIKPTLVPHLAAVYRSEIEQVLRVAFSMPIETSGIGPAPDVVGVLAMTVNLGQFAELKSGLSAGFEVVLIDLRSETPDKGGRTGRGLVLHHSKLDFANVQWVSKELLERIDDLLLAKTRQSDEAIMMADYRDEIVTGGQRYWGAVMPIIDKEPEFRVGNIGWAVLVQEPL